MFDRYELDRASPVPLYHQIERALRAFVADAETEPGTALPTEEALVEGFGVSRSTVRQALERLARDGLVERRPARGTRVARRPMTETFRWLDSSALVLLDQGRDVRTDFFQVRLAAPAPARAVRALGLAEGERVHVVRRVTVVDDVPQNLATTYVRARLVPDLARGHLTARGRTQSLYYVLRMRFGIVLASADVEVAPHALTATEAARLRRPPGTPALRRTRLVRTLGDAPLLFDDAVLVHAFRLTSASRLHDPSGGLA